MVVLGGVAVPYERGNPVLKKAGECRDSNPNFVSLREPLEAQWAEDDVLAISHLPQVFSSSLFLSSGTKV